MNNQLKDDDYKKNPQDYALLKEVSNGRAYFTIYCIVNNKLMMTLIDDFEYAIALGNDMHEFGIVTFDTFNDLLKWQNEKSSNG